MTVEPALLDWMLDSDPGLRWQVQRDLAGAPAEVWRATRERTATEGHGARLLALQDPDGQWAGGSYFPRRPDGPDPDDSQDDSPDEGPDEGQPWTATTWTLNTLRDLGVPATALGDTAERLAVSSRWDYNGEPYWAGEVDACINAFTLANGAWLGADVEELGRWFGAHQLPDGGWNCEWVEGSTRSSFHSTLNTLKGLLAHEELTGGTDELRAARRTGQEYLLERRLLYRRSTGERVGPWVDWFGYPFRWVYTALNALDHFRAAAVADGVPPDPRLADAVEVVRAAREPDGRWRQGQHYPGAVWFELDVPVGEPSPWLTFVGTRALAWWDESDRS